MSPTAKTAAALLPALAAALTVALAAPHLGRAKEPDREGGPAPAAEPAPSAAASAEPAPSAAASAEPASSAAPSTADAGPTAPPAPSIGVWAPPEDTSPMPKREDWARAAPLSLLRPRHGCAAAALREWIRISCPFAGWPPTMGGRVLAGSEEGVHLYDEKGRKGDSIDSVVHVAFPVRRGDRRLIAVDTWDSAGWKSFAIIEDTAIAISETWLPGARRPTIVVD